jgi:hypothetical protein
MRGIASQNSCLGKYSLALAAAIGLCLVYVPSFTIIGIALFVGLLLVVAAGVRYRISNYGAYVAYWVVTLVNELSFRIRPVSFILSGSYVDSVAILKIASVAMAGLYAVWLVGLGRQRLDLFLRRPLAWVTALIGLGALSVLWSVAPIFTAYRVVELSIVLILILRLCSGIDSHVQFARISLLLLLPPICVGLLNGAWNIGAEITHETLSHVLSEAPRMFRDNIAAAIAAVLTVASFSYVMAGKSFGLRAWPWFILGIVSLGLFDSTASTFACTAGIGVVLVGQRRFWFGVIFLTGAFIAGVLFDPSTERWWDIIFSGKSERRVYTISGRLPLWEAMWEYAWEQPMGFGFAAGDRFTLFTLRPSIGFEAIHAHNGFISIWFGTGWLGLVLVLGAFGALWWYGFASLRGAESNFRSAWLGMITVLSVNNLTILGVGGWYNPAWVPFLAMLIFASRRAGDTFAQGEDDPGIRRSSRRVVMRR